MGAQTSRSACRTAYPFLVSAYCAFRTHDWYERCTLYQESETMDQCQRPTRQAQFSQTSQLSLSRYLQAVIEHTTGSCKPIHLRPGSAHITFWTQCIALRLDESLWKAAEELLADRRGIGLQEKLRKADDWFGDYTTLYIAKFHKPGSVK